MFSFGLCQVLRTFIDGCHSNHSNKENSIFAVSIRTDPIRGFILCVYFVMIKGT